MRVFPCATLLLILAFIHGMSQMRDSTLVKMTPQFPKVGESIELILAYPNFNTRIQERIYSYQNNEEIIFEGVDFQEIRDSKVIIVLRLRAKHSGVVSIPPIIENTVHTIRISPISVLGSFYETLPSQTVMWDYPPFPLLEVLYIFITVIASIVCVVSSIAIARALIPMLRSFLQRIHNTYNVVIASSIVKKLLRHTRNMEKPTFTRETISSFDFYSRMYKALEIRFCFLYGLSFKTRTTEEIETLLLCDIQRAMTQYRLPEQQRISQEMLHDFFNTLTEVVYGKKLSELSLRIIHCHVLLRLFFISTYIFNAKKNERKNGTHGYDSFSLADSRRKRSHS